MTLFFKGTFNPTLKCHPLVLLFIYHPKLLVWWHRGVWEIISIRMYINLWLLALRPQWIFSLKKNDVDCKMSPEPPLRLAWIPNGRNIISEWSSPLNGPFFIYMPNLCVFSLGHIWTPRSWVSDPFPRSPSASLPSSTWRWKAGGR